PASLQVDRHERPPRSRIDAPRQGTAERTAHTVRYRFIDSRVGPLVRAAIMFAVLMIGIVAVPAIASAQDAPDADGSDSGSPPWVIKTKDSNAGQDDNGMGNDDEATDDVGDDG